MPMTNQPSPRGTSPCSVCSSGASGTMKPGACRTGRALRKCEAIAGGRRLVDAGRPQVDARTSSDEREVHVLEPPRPLERLVAVATAALVRVPLVRHHRLPVLRPDDAAVQVAVRSTTLEEEASRLDPPALG